MTSNWPQVSDLKKPELYVIQLGELSTSWKFEGNQSKTVSWTGAKRKLKFDHDLVPVFLTWWPDPRSPGPEIFRSYVKRLPHRLCQIWRRCAPPFLRYLQKTLGGGGASTPLPGRGLTRAPLGGLFIAPLPFFCNNFQTAWRIDTKLSVPSAASIWHLVSKF